MGSGSHLAAAHGREAARSDVRFMEESGNAVVRLARFGGLIVGDESRNQEENHMGARCFGEFLGTAVLILLGDGVVANVLLKRSKAEGAGWLGIAGLGIRRGVWRVHGNRLRQSGWLYQPGIHARHGGLVGRFFEVLAVPGGTGVGRD